MNGSNHRPAPAGWRRGLLAAWRAHVCRRELRAGLARLDDRLLRDIGLTRGTAEDLLR